MEYLILGGIIFFDAVMLAYLSNKYNFKWYKLHKAITAWRKEYGG